MARGERNVYRPICAIGTRVDTVFLLSAPEKSSSDYRCRVVSKREDALPPPSRSLFGRNRSPRNFLLFIQFPSATTFTLSLWKLCLGVPRSPRAYPSISILVGGDDDHSVVWTFSLVGDDDVIEIEKNYYSFYIDVCGVCPYAAAAAVVLLLQNLTHTYTHVCSYKHELLPATRIRSIIILSLASYLIFFHEMCSDLFLQWSLKTDSLWSLLLLSLRVDA